MDKIGLQAVFDIAPFKAGAAAFDSIISRLNNTIGGFGSGLIKLGAMTGGALLGIGAAGQLLRQMERAMTALFTPLTQVDLAWAKLNASLERGGKVIGWTSDEADALARQLAASTRYTYDQYLTTEALALSYLRLSKEDMPRVIKLSADMATIMGTDLKTAAIQLGKALNNPAIGFVALRRIGVSFTDAERDMVVQMARTGRMAEAQAYILNRLEQAFSGAAQAAGTTLVGQIDILRNRLQMLWAALGKPLITAFKQGLATLGDAAIRSLETLSRPVSQLMSVFLPFINLLVRELGKIQLPKLEFDERQLTDIKNTAIDFVAGFVMLFREVWGYAQIVWTLVKPLVDLLLRLSGISFNNMIRSFEILTQWIRNVQDTVVAMIEAFPHVSEAASSIWESLKQGVIGVFDVLTEPIRQRIEAIQQVVTAVFDLVSRTITRIIREWQMAFNLIATLYQTHVKPVVDYVTYYLAIGWETFVSSFKEVVLPALQQVGQAVVNVGQAAYRALLPVLEAIGEWLKGMRDFFVMIAEEIYRLVMRVLEPLISALERLKIISAETAAAIRGALSEAGAKITATESFQQASKGWQGFIGQVRELGEQTYNEVVKVFQKVPEEVGAAVDKASDLYQVNKKNRKTYEETVEEIRKGVDAASQMQEVVASYPAGISMEVDVDEQSAKDAEQRLKSLISKVQGWFQEAVNYARNLALLPFEGTLDLGNIFKPGANGPFEPIYRAMDVVKRRLEGREESPWAAMFANIPFDTLRKAVADFQAGFFSPEVLQVLGGDEFVNKMVDLVNWAQMVEAANQRLFEEIARRANRSAAVVKALFGLGGDPVAVAGLQAGASGAAELVAETVASKTGLMETAGKDMIQAMIDGMNSMKGALLDSATAIANALIDAIVSTLRPNGANPQPNIPQGVVAPGGGNAGHVIPRPNNIALTINVTGAAAPRTTANMVHNAVIQALQSSGLM
jgi:phage-related protein